MQFLVYGLKKVYRLLLKSNFQPIFSLPCKRVEFCPFFTSPEKILTAENSKSDDIYALRDGVIRPIISYEFL